MPALPPGEQKIVAVLAGQGQALSQVSYCFLVAAIAPAQVGQVQKDGCLVQPTARPLDEVQCLAIVAFSLLRVAAGIQDKAECHKRSALELAVGRLPGALEGRLALPPRLPSIVVVQGQPSQPLV